MPWLRAVDGLNTHDDSYKLSAAGGITTYVAAISNLPIRI